MSPKRPPVRLKGDTMAGEEKSSGGPDGEQLWLVPTQCLASLCPARGQNLESLELGERFASM